MRLVLVALAISLGGVAESLPAKASTLAWYRFRAGPNGAAVTSVADSGPHALTGVGTGALTYSSEIPVRSAAPYSLNATADYDYVTVPDAAALRPAGNFTLSVWAMPTGSQTPDFDTIVTKNTGVQWGNSLSSYVIGYRAESGAFVAAIDGSSDSSTPSIEIVSKGGYAQNAWHFLELKYTIKASTKAATLAFYVDGVNQGELKLKDFPGIYYSTGPLLIGAGNWGSGDHDYYRRNFIGYIDEVKLTSP